MKVVLRSVLGEDGVLFVMMASVELMQLLCVNNWGFQ